MGSGTPAIHCHTARGQWVVDILRCTATLPGSNRQCNSCNAQPQCLGAMGKEPLVSTCTLAAGSRQRTSWNGLQHRFGVVGIGMVALHCNIACGQLAGGTCNAPPQCLRAVGSGIAPIHCRGCRRAVGRYLLHCGAQARGLGRGACGAPETDAPLPVLVAPKDTDGAHIVPVDGHVLDLQQNRRSP